ncbi:putative OB-fold protein [Novosphingobium kunmingense]|uniref:Putative OB-fold protein n=1 Tax=Novosphingobium kunmingense TaxID=1211806 RepID=A0A2N0H617_9SPHN|nr:OB-fold domain-containing protein [Novosphingobium kunmingense]PKB14373.1 putative OB-fold protein [Novosphingobium kunmingense]
MALPPTRILPVIDKDNAAYWTWGANGELAIHRCADCGYRVHPPVPFCPACDGRSVGPEAVSGRGRVTTFTVNHKQWVPGLAVPYVLALVELVEQPDVRLVANITHCDPGQVRFGMEVEVWFEPVEDLWVPLFRPARGAA